MNVKWYRLKNTKTKKKMLLICLWLILWYQRPNLFFIVQIIIVIIITNKQSTVSMECETTMTTHCLFGSVIFWCGDRKSFSYIALLPVGWSSWQSWNGQFCFKVSFSTSPLPWHRRNDDKIRSKKKVFFFVDIRQNIKMKFIGLSKWVGSYFIALVWCIDGVSVLLAYTLTL